MNKNKAMFPGSFDPPTLGHIDIIKRCASLYDTVYVVVAVNSAKKGMFSEEERVDILKEILKDIPNIQVVSWHGLVIDFAKQNDVGVIIRGVRAQGDFAYEFELAETYRLFLPDVEVLFMPTDPKYFLLRSSSIKEMAAYGADISKMVPKQVETAMAAKKNC